MQTFLSYGDGESAVKITFQNERILDLLEHPKAKKDSEYDELNTLVLDCISIQEKCDSMLVAISLEYKKELNTHMIKRQLKSHLQKNT
ncbi:MAG TPA: hypothetical protein PK079_19360 [Leptospiraceae bacterium]|nr:hypothetical protein [Leptospiraceae bacterium]HMW05621.1 hypothetical protein [Leptospiraceae bacterium]HMX34497.1 hypothetical protein [Leptospiraceae bacterium]HMY31130.1 hypothetical protein [Leptospiraceae bacterium]HMZ63713.1 hypothetical protein [Leptospiraceae bacterium]